MMRPYEHTHQFLTHMLSISVKIPNLKRSLQSMLSIRVRNWCVHWAYARGTDACTKRTRQELMRALSVRVRNCCVRWACASKIKWFLALPKTKVTSLFFSPKITNPERLYGKKIMKVRAIENLILGQRNLNNVTVKSVFVLFCNSRSYESRLRVIASKLFIIDHNLRTLLVYWFQNSDFRT